MGSSHSFLSLLSLVLLIGSVAANNPKFKPPPPLPEPVWVNKTTTNYTILHEKYADFIVCMYMPVGVIGVYQRSATFAIALVTAYEARRDSGKYMTTFQKTRRYLIGILSGVYGFYTAYQNGSTIRGCKAFGVVAGGAYAGLVTSAAVTLGALWLALGGGSMAVLLLLAAAFFEWVTGTYYMAAVLAPIKQAVPQTNLNLILFEKAALKPTIVAFIPILIFALVGFAGIVWLCGAGGNSRGCSFIVLPIVLLVYLGMALLQVEGWMVMGKIVGDPWGKYALRRPSGAAGAVLGFTIPPLEVIMAFVPA